MDSGIKTNRDELFFMLPGVEDATVDICMHSPDTQHDTEIWNNVPYDTPDNVTVADGLLRRLNKEANLWFAYNVGGSALNMFGCGKIGRVKDEVGDPLVRIELRPKAWEIIQDIISRKEYLTQDYWVLKD